MKHERDQRRSSSNRQGYKQVGHVTSLPECDMPNLNTLLDEHVVLKYEFPDRFLLNGYIAKLQKPSQLSWFLCQHRGEEIPRYELLGEMTRSFIAAIEKYAGDRKIPIVPFERGQRKETIAEPHFAEGAKAGREGVVVIGVSQERANVFRAPAKRRVPGRYAAGRGSAFVRFIYFTSTTRTGGPASFASAPTLPSASGSGSTVISGCDATWSVAASPI